MAPEVIDSLEFARAAESLRGEACPAQLERLRDVLFDDSGSLSYSLQGRLDTRGRPRLRLMVDGEVYLRCQRCLGRLRHEVRVVSNLLVLTSGSGGAAGDIEDLDGVPADPQTKVLSLVEDEVLLAIPYAARHPDGSCTTAVDAAGDRPASPFAVLHKLKQDGN